MQVTTIGIVGYGHFGKFLVELAGRFLPDVQVRVYSRRSEPDEKLFFNLENVSHSDVVILCGSIGGYEAQLESILPHLGEESVVVDVATVKKHTSDLFKKHLEGKRYFCCHPMFGAESYKKTDGDVCGYRIVVTDKTIGEETHQVVKTFLVGLGFDVVEMTADEHDKLLADTLFMTHYIGQVMNSAGFARTNIDTVSFQSLMNAVESVAHDEKLFLDVYNHNPYCERAVVRFRDAEEEVLRGLLG